jgi:heptosyltransferase-2
MKLMVRVPNWVGDAVMCLPALEHLRRSLPNDEMVLVARPVVGDLHSALAAYRVLSYDPKNGRAAVVATLRRERFDRAILLPNSFDAAWVAWRAGIPERWGYARDCRAPLLTRAIPPPRSGEIPAHQAYYYLELLRRLGLPDNWPPPEQFSLPGSGQVGNLPHLVVGLNPGAAYGTAKRWLPGRYVELGRRLRHEKGAELILFGAESERPLADEIARQIGAGALSTAGRTTMADFLKLAGGVDLFITNDNGTMHVAAAAGIPVLAIFGSTDELATSPLGLRTRIIKRPVPCSPCLLRHCPVDHRCMRDISVDEVFEAACQMIPSARRSS